MELNVDGERVLTWLISSTWGIPLAAFLAFFFIGAGKLLAAVLLLHDPWNHKGLLALDAILSGAFAGILVSVVLGLVRARRRRLLEYIRRVADLNHHIRNALQVIVYHAALSKTDPRGVEQIEDAVKRVDAALQEIFPIFGDDRKHPTNGVDRDWIS